MKNIQYYGSINKIIKRWVCVVLTCVLLLTGLPLDFYKTVYRVAYASTYTVGNSKYAYYEWKDGTLSIYGYDGTDTEIEIPKEIDGKKVTAIEAFAFSGCSNLTSIKIPEGITNIEEYTFEGCSSLTDIEIPEGIIDIGAYAFARCSSLTGIEIPEGVTSIGDGVFNCCSSLTSIEIPEGVTSIGDGAFDCCSSLTSIKILEGVTSIGDYAFVSCSSLTSIKIPEGVTSIGDGTFSYCRSLTSIEIPEEVTSIGDYAFSCCSSLTSIEIPEEVTGIGDYAFYGCSSLTSIEIPEEVTSIGIGTFAKCSSLTSIIVDDKNKEYKSINGILFDCAETKIIKYPGGKKESNYIVTEGITYIEAFAFDECCNLINIEIPEGVTNIGDYAFSNCSSLRSIEIPEGVTSISKGTFKSCSSLTSIEIPERVTDIGPVAFNGCSSLMNIKIPEGVTDISNYTFTGCSELTNIDIPNGVTSIGDGGFGSCSNLTCITIPETVTSIGTYTFDGCDNLTIYGYSNSYAETYAQNNNIPFIAIESESDAYIIDRVKKYTTSELYAQLDFIMQQDTCDDFKFYKLNELFKNAGLTDVKEGIEYVSEATPYRQSYEFLTNNELYGAYNFANWLYSPAGTAKRALLCADDVIFNLEFLEYTKIDTYVNDDYPGVAHYKKLLRDFMLEENNECKVLSKSNSIAKSLKNIIALNNIVETDSMNSLMDKIVNCESESELSALQDEFVEKYIVPELTTEENLAKVKINANDLAKAVGYAGGIIDLTDATVKDINAIINLENELETYEKYSNFLLTIYQSKDVSLGLRFAAYSLLDDIENGYYKRITTLFTDVISKTDSLLSINKTKLETQAGGASFSDAISTLKYAVFVSNLIIDTGDFVDSAMAAMAYGELTLLYQIKLDEDKQIFLDNPTSENAWQFFEDYTLLWDLRYHGESKWLEMGKLQIMAGIFEIPTYGYEERKEIVDYNIEQLEKCKFVVSPEFNVPDSVQYVKKAVISCPVNVEVYTKDGTMVANLKDEEECDITNEYGRFAVIKQSYNGEYAKVICQSTDEELTIKITAVEEGLVDYQFLRQDDADIYAFDKLEVKKGDIIGTTTKISTVGQYTIDKDGNGTIDSKNDFILTNTENYIPVTLVTADKTSVTLEKGKRETIAITVNPSYATNTTMQWISEDESIATVDNGVVKGISEGKTVIYAKAVDSENIFVEINITVIKPSYISGDADSDGEITSADAVIIKKYLAGYSDLNIDEEAGDVDGDGEITSGDSVMLLKYLAGYDIALK